MKIIIVGAGEVGFHIAGRLAKENKDVVVIDKNPAALRRVSESLDVQVLEGSGASPVVLEEAGLKNAEILLAVTDSDETNLVSCLFADMLSPATKTLIRIRNPDYTGFTENLTSAPPHIDTFINPEMELVRTVQRFLEVPGAVDVAEFADGKLKLVGVRIEPLSAMAGVQLMAIPGKLGGKRILIAAIMRDEEIIIPTGRDEILSGDVVYVVAEKENLKDTLRVFGIRSKPVKRAIIIGGGGSGFAVASALCRQGYQVKIIEKNPDRCMKIAEELDHVVVLNGDGSDQELLFQENVQDMDVTLTLTDDEETNILTSLLVRRMGVERVITRIDRFSYLPLVGAIGIEPVISSRLSAINSILQHVRRGKVLSSVSLKGEQAEVLEAEALETSDVVGKPIKDLPFPKGALIIAILRDGKVIIPSGESRINHLDRIVVLAQSQTIPKVEKALAVKLEFF